MNRAFIVAILLLSVFLSSCAVDSVVLKPNYDFKKIKRVAVLEFRDSAYYPNSGSMAAQLFVKYLLKSGYNVVERDELESLLRERQLTMAGLVESPSKALGKLSGIDAIITGAIPMVVPERDFYDNGYPRYIAAQVGITCRMISVETGEVLWAGSNTYDAMNTQTAFEYLISSLVTQLNRDLNRVAAKMTTQGS
jgi:hypothetical protein